MLDVLLLVAAVSGEPGFGGAAPGGAESSCLVQDDSGAWLDCSELLSRGAPPPTAAAPLAAPDAATSVEKLVERLPASPLAPKPKRLTPIEEELARVGRTADEFPLAALRRDVQRFDVELEEMDARGAPLAQKVPVEERRAAARAVLETVEAVAVQRMSACAARRGIQLDVKPFRMTAAGPVPLSQQELTDAVPKIDVAGCERFNLIDQPLIDRVQRIEELKRTLAKGGFGYHRIAERRALEEELERAQEELALDGAPRVVVPGATGL